MSPTSRRRRRPAPRPRSNARPRPGQRQRGTGRGTKQRLLATVILVALLALVLSMLAMTAANAVPGVTVTETGWWSRNPFAAPPDGGFQVATAPDGPVSVSAVRLAIEGEIDKAILIVNEAGGVPDAAAVRACLTGAAWSAADHSWGSRPSHSCDDGIGLSRNPSAANWTADITALLQGSDRSVSVVLVPDGSTAPAWQVDFSVAFVAAEARADVRKEPEPGAQPAASGQIASSSSSAGAMGDQMGPTAPNAFDLAGTAEAAAPIADADTTLADDPAPSDDTAGGDVAAATSGFAPTSTRSDQPWGRLLVFLPLSMLAGAAVALARRRLLHHPG